MNTVTQCFYRSIRQCYRAVPVKRKWQRTPTFHCQFTTTIPRFKDAGDDDEPTPRRTQVDGVDANAVLFRPEDLDHGVRTYYDSLSDSEQQEMQQQWAQVQTDLDPRVLAAVDEEVETTMRRVDREGDRDDELSLPDTRQRGRELGFWADDEVDEDAMVEDGDDEFRDDEITSMAHAELELHREIREYTRRAAWEMPFLTSLAKPFQPPDQTKLPLRFRYTTYMGESHPAQKKVVVDFELAHLPLDSQQRTKLIKLLGPRYNPSTETAKMSCEKFENAAQNKRYLGDLVNSLIAEAKDSRDTLEDIPLDLRHHKRKRKLEFPAEWRLGNSPAKVERLLQERAERRQLEEGRGVVDGDREVQMQYAYAGQ